MNKWTILHTLCLLNACFLITVSTLSPLFGACGCHFNGHIHPVSIQSSSTVVSAEDDPSSLNGVTRGDGSRSQLPSGSEWSPTLKLLTPITRPHILHAAAGSHVLTSAAQDQQMFAASAVRGCVFSLVKLKERFCENEIGFCHFSG